MQKLGNLDKWYPIQAGQSMTFPVKRKVRLQVITPVNTAWHLENPETGKTKVASGFLTVTTGREIIEFVAEPGMRLIPDQGVRVYTAENETVHIPETGKVSYAKIANRQDRNPELERVAYMAAQNAVRRQQQMHDEEMRRMQAEKDRQIAAVRAEGTKVDETTGEIADGGTTDEGTPKSVPQQKPDATDAGAKVDSGKATAKDGQNTGGEGG